MTSSRMIAVFVAGAMLWSCARFPIAPQVTPTSSLPRHIWSGTSAGYTIDWTTADITAAPQASHGGAVLSELGRAVVDFHAISRKQTSDCDMVRQARLQSVVGSLVSIQSADTMKCTNGSNGTHLSTVAVDLAHPKATLRLTKFFTAGQLAELRSKAARVCKTVPADLLGRFAFGQMRGRTVVVALTLTSDCTQSSVEAALPTPPSLQAAVALAAQRKQGFLWHDQPAVSGGATTTVTYHYRTTIE